MSLRSCLVSLSYLPSSLPSLYSGYSLLHEIIPHGQGTAITQSDNHTRAVFQGEWLFGLPHGTGTFTSSTFSYIGNWKNGKRDGFGVLKENNKIVYEGLWENDVKEGKGNENYVFNGLTVYFTGMFKNGKRNGAGTLICSTDSSRYDGLWKDGLRSGKAIERYSDGSYYDGIFLNDKRHGYGVWVDKNRSIKYTGQWENGELVKSLAGISK